MKPYKFLIAFFLVTQALTAQTDSLVIRKIFDQSLTNGMSYTWLDHLTNKIGGRLSGSENAEKAVLWGKSELEKLGLKVWLQPVMVPKWVRGDKEVGSYTTNGKSIPVRITALGRSVATPASGVKAQVIEVKSVDELKKLDRKTVEGKIVFLNSPMDPTFIESFPAYGKAVRQRVAGAAEAAKLGAVGAIVRSVTLSLDTVPHTGTLSYGDLPDNMKIPSAAISTIDSEKLSAALKKDPELSFYFKQNCRSMGEVPSFNVIGEWRGTEYPDQIMVVGGHLDSWDTGTGAHDDGAGIVQSMDVVRLLKNSGIKPKHTLRVVLFMNEENGLRGGKKYAEIAKAKKEHHIFALESDSGGFTPRGFSVDCKDAAYAKFVSWKPLFEPYRIHYFERKGSGADIGPLKDGKVVLAGLRPDSQRYFDVHHAPTDTFDRVNKRELELGAAAMASLIYLVDKYGF